MLKIFETIEKTLKFGSCRREREEEDEKKLKEEEQRRKEEKAKIEEEEYQKLKAAFEVEETGFDEEEVGEGEGEDKLKQFVDYIKEQWTDYWFCLLSFYLFLSLTPSGWAGNG